MPDRSIDDPTTPPLFDRVEQAVARVRQDATEQPTVGVILGSGLGAFADMLEGALRIPYQDIPHFPTSHVEGHAGQLVIGDIGETRCVVMQGRVHYYEGYTMEAVTFPVRVLAGLGVRSLVVTNAAGTVNPDFTPGDLMIITDQINLTGDNPLRGPNDDRFGVRFPDMSHAYSTSLSAKLREAAQTAGCSLQQGVYCGLAGPSYETPAEIRMLHTLGADAVGMSTVAEVIVANHAGMEVAGLSVITNFAAGLSSQPLSHDEVTATGEKVRDQLCKMLRTAIGGLHG